MRGPSTFRRQRHSARTAYIIYVLWMIGHSQRTIGGALGLRPKQVAGIINNSSYRGRAAMTDGEIRSHLLDLEAIRFDESGVPLDGGVLDRIRFEPRPLDARQRRGPLRRRMR